MELLSLWAAGFYLLNKICFSIAETQAEVRKRKLIIIGWVVYILGVPAWFIILMKNNNWIAASMELGGIPAMLLGLYYAIYHQKTLNKTADRTTSLITYCFIVVGVSYSIYTHGGLSAITQWLEIGVMIGFLLGGYLLAKKNHYGWLFFMLMNISMGTLMLLQDKLILAIQQMVSLGFVAYGFYRATTAKRVEAR